MIAQFSLFRLGHIGNLLVDPQIVGFHLQPGLGQVITESTQRLQLSGNTRLELLHGVLNGDVEEGTEVIAKLGEVLTHKLRSVCGIAKASQQSVEHTLISHPVGRINAITSETISA